MNAPRDVLTPPADPPDSVPCASAVVGAPCPRALQCAGPGCGAWARNPSASSPTGFAWVQLLCGGPCPPPELPLT